MSLSETKHKIVRLHVQVFPLLKGQRYDAPKHKHNTNKNILHFEVFESICVNKCASKMWVVNSHTLIFHRSVTTEVLFSVSSVACHSPAITSRESLDTFSFILGLVVIVGLRPITTFKLFSVCHKLFANVNEQFENVVHRKQKWLADGENAQRTKVDNYLVVITHFNQCNICSYLKNKLQVKQQIS